LRSASDDEFANRGFVRGQLWLTTTAEPTGLIAPCRLKTLQNFDDEADADIELPRSLASRKTTRDRTHHPLSKVIGIRFGHLGRPPIWPQSWISF
jgi:hypothetical protein